MDDIEQKARALVAPSVACEVNFENISILARAFTSAIEQRDAAKQELADYKQEVSDAVEAVLDRYYVLNIEDMLSRFIIPATKPDPLVEVLLRLELSSQLDAKCQHDADAIRAALDAAGFEIREKNDG